MLPYRDINPTSRFAWVTLGLIIANVMFFLFVEPIGQGQGDQQSFLLCHAEIPYEVTHQTSLAHGGSGAAAAIASDYNVSLSDAPQLQAQLRQTCADKSWLGSIFESMFLHARVLHIFGNMLFLWVFGNNVEDRFGRIRYLLFYFAGGLAAAALMLAFGPNSTIPNLGASGAIAAVLGAYFILFPRARVQTIVFIFPVTLRAEFVLGFWFLLQFVDGVGGLGTNSNGGVAYWAHVGGFLFGLLITLLFFRGGTSGRARADAYSPAGYS